MSSEVKLIRLIDQLSYARAADDVERLERNHHAEGAQVSIKIGELLLDRDAAGIFLVIGGPPEIFFEKRGRFKIAPGAQCPDIKRWIIGELGNSHLREELAD